MKSRSRKAGVLSLAASMMIAATGALGSGASAEDRAPLLVQAQPAIQFTNDAVVQALPAEPAPLADQVAPQAPADEADTLQELVAAQSQPESLSPEMQCLAGAIYFEAKGQVLAGQLAVGRVIVARTKSGRFPSSYCGVVYQRSQFGFIRGNRMPTIAKNSRAWRDAVAIAQIADSNSWRSPTEGALYFHATHVSPRWRMTRIARVDDHIFYR